MSNPDLSDAQLIRYSRHLLLPEIDIEGQQRLTRSKALIIGAGGLGSPAAMYLAASGVGQITLFDHDHVDLGNLQRQIAFRNSDIAQQKSETLAKTLVELNPEIQVMAVPRRAEGTLLEEAVAANDIVIDASDNFTTRFEVNAACMRHQKPLVSGAAIGFEGQVTVLDGRDDTSPCYQCLYPEGEGDAPRCAESGVFAPLTGIIGSMQAAETLKLLIYLGNPLAGRLLRINALTMEIRTSTFKKDPDCPICGRQQGS